MPRYSIDTLLKRTESLTHNGEFRLRDILPLVDHDDPRVRAAYARLLWKIPCDATFATLKRLIRSEGVPDVQAEVVTAMGRYIWSGMQLDPVLDEEFGFGENVLEEEVAEARSLLLEVFEDPGRTWDVRARTLEALSWDPDDRTCEHILDLWDSDDEHEQVTALSCMGRSAHRAFRETILNNLEASSPGLRKAAIGAVGEACLEAAESNLLSLTEHEDKELVLAAIWALRNVAYTPAGRGRLEALARSQDPETKGMAQKALRELDAMDGAGAPGGR